LAREWEFAEEPNSAPVTGVGHCKINPPEFLRTSHIVSSTSMTEDTKDVLPSLTLSLSGERLEGNSSAHPSHRSARQAPPDHVSTGTSGRASEVESERCSLYPVTSYASTIGGGGPFPSIQNPEPQNEPKDPNVVEWDGPKDPANPYNW